jgi:hypothetical protein
MRVVHAADPAASARELARQLGGDAVGDIVQLERAVAMRTGDAPDEAVERLADLAADVARAARIRQRTEVAFGEALARRMTSPNALAIHPSSLENAARALGEAMKELTLADDAMARHGPAPRGADEADDDDRALAALAADLAGASDDDDDFAGASDDDDFVGLPSIRTRAAAAFFVVVGGGLVLTGTGMLPYVALIGFAVVGAAVAALLLRLRNARQRQAVEAAEGRRVSRQSLADVAAVTERSGQAAELARMELDAWRARHETLTRLRRDASDRVRQARRNWESLAGPGADPDDLEEILRAHDPQRSIAGVTAESSPTIRAVAALHRRALARWRVAWAALGYDAAPPADQAVATLAALRAERARRPLVVVDPEPWVEPDRLAAALARLPEGVEVVVVRPARAEPTTPGVS